MRKRIGNITTHVLVNSICDELGIIRENPDSKKLTHSEMVVILSFIRMSNNQLNKEISDGD